MMVKRIILVMGIVGTLITAAAATAGAFGWKRPLVDGDRTLRDRLGTRWSTMPTVWMLSRT